MRKIGITGGIGSGKSVVCDIFRTLGSKVYNADDRAKVLLDTNPDIKNAIIRNFGDTVYHSGSIDRKLLATKVFSNPQALTKLNSIVHPAVFEDFNQWADRHKNEPYIIKEAAIMFESGANNLLDSVVLVYSPVEVRIKRVMERDKLGREAVLARINNQMDEDEKKKLSDFIIYNDEEHSLIKQVLILHNTFIS